MSGEHQAFADWLRERAEKAGYDFAKRGTISRLAEDSGNDPAQMSRFLRGQAIPAIDGQAGLARALGIKLPPVMIATGTAEPDDFPSDPVDGPVWTRSSYDIELILKAYAEDLGMSEDQTRRFIRMVKLIAADYASSDPAATAAPE